MEMTGDPLYGPHRCTCSPTVLVCPACHEYARGDRRGSGFQGKHIKDSADVAARRAFYADALAAACAAGQRNKMHQYRQVLTRLAAWEESSDATRC